MSEIEAEFADRHPSTVQMLRWFDFEHLPPHLQAISAPFGRMVREMLLELPDNAETSTMLRKLLEAKDAAVRSALTVVQSRERHAAPAPGGGGPVVSGGGAVEGPSGGDLGPDRPVSGGIGPIEPVEGVERLVRGDCDSRDPFGDHQRCELVAGHEGEHRRGPVARW